MADGVNIFMPFYVGDYLADTGDLSTEEHGAYMLLLIHMWRQDGSLTSSHERLARITGVSPERWGTVWQSIARFFQVNDGTITNRRLTAELMRAKARKESAVAKAKAGAKAKWDHASSNASSNASSRRQALLGTCPPPSPSPSQPHAPTASKAEELPLVPATPDITPWSIRMMERIRAMTLAWRGSYPKPLSDEAWPKTSLKGADAIGKIVRIDGHTAEDVEFTIAFLEGETPKNGFCWREQVQSGQGLREKWDRIQDARKRPAATGYQQDARRGVAYSGTDEEFEEMARKYGRAGG